MAEKRDEKPRDEKPAADVGKATDEVQAAVDEETDRGFRGVEVDQVPNEAYTVAGVVKGLPTPEGPDADKAAKPAV